MVFELVGGPAVSVSMPLYVRILIWFVIFLSAVSAVVGRRLIGKPREPMVMWHWVVNLVYFGAVIIICAWALSVG